MRQYTIKGAFAAFYYLMTADNEIGIAETEQLNQIVAELDPEGISLDLDGLKRELDARRTEALEGDEQYDILAEGADAALLPEPKEGEVGISPRLLVWNLLVMATADGDYHPNERRLTRHIARVSGVEKSVFLEMEQLVQTGAAIAKEISWLAASSKPYNEVQPMIVELENRQKVILDEAKALLKDEQENGIEALKYEPDFVDEALDSIGKAGTAVAESVGKAVTPVFEKVGNQAGKVFGGLKGFLKKKEGPAEPQTGKNEHTEEGADV